MPVHRGRGSVDLTSRGLIRVIDLQFGMKTAAGELIALESYDLTDAEVSNLAP